MQSGFEGVEPRNLFLTPIPSSPQGKMVTFSRRPVSLCLKEAGILRLAKDGCSKHNFLGGEQMVLRGKRPIGLDFLLLWWEGTPPPQDGKGGSSSTLTCWFCVGPGPRPRQYGGPSTPNGVGLRGRSFARGAFAPRHLCHPLGWF